MKEQNLLSLFDGMACGRLALTVAGIPVAYYAASEIEKSPMKVAKHNYFDIDHVGDVCDLNPYDFRNINLIIGGSPCQSISGAGKLKGLTTNDGQEIRSLNQYLLLKSMGYSYDKKSLKYFNSSCLFWEYVRIYRGIKQYNPNVKFLLENVVNKYWGELISKEMDVEPIQINSSMVSAQNRDRYYWTNIEYTPIPYSGQKIWDVIPNAISGAGSRGVPQKNWTKTEDNPHLHKQKTTVRKDNLANCLTASGGKICRKYLSSIDENLHVINIDEAEQLQTVPIGFTNVPGVSEYQRFKMLGNGWTINVIAHFFTCLRNEIVRKETMLVTDRNLTPRVTF